MTTGNSYVTTNIAKSLPMLVVIIADLANIVCQIQTGYNRMVYKLHELPPADGTTTTVIVILHQYTQTRRE